MINAEALALLTERERESQGSGIKGDILEGISASQMDQNGIRDGGEDSGMHDIKGVKGVKEAYRRRF